MERKRKTGSNGRPRYNTAGEANGMSRLTADNVREIVARVWAGEVYQKIADSFGVQDSLITGIMTGRLWKSVTSTIAGFVRSQRGFRKGERHGGHKLTDAEVLLIRERLAAGYSMWSTAPLFKVNYTTIRKIKLNILRKHVQLPAAA